MNNTATGEDKIHLTYEDIYQLLFDSFAMNGVMRGHSSYLLDRMYSLAKQYWLCTGNEERIDQREFQGLLRQEKFEKESWILIKNISQDADAYIEMKLYANTFDYFFSASLDV